MKLKGMAGQLVFVAMCLRRPMPGRRGCFGWEERPVPGRTCLAVGVLENGKLAKFSTEKPSWLPFLSIDMVSLSVAKHVVIEANWYDDGNSGKISANSLCPTQENPRMVNGPIPIKPVDFFKGRSPAPAYPGTFLDLIVGNDQVNEFVDNRLYPRFCDQGGDWEKILGQLGVSGYFKDFSDGI